MKENRHTASNILFGIGLGLAFLGFIWPGWLWVLRTPGDVEMLPLAAMTIVGIAGVLSLIAGGVQRVSESKNIQKMDNE